jgi:branched-chain amino acid transport system permease protein
LFAGAHFTAIQVIIVLVSGADDGRLLAGLSHQTRHGHARHRAEPAVASLMGVNINRVIAAAFVIGSALGALAGVMVGGYYEIAHYQMGFMLGLKAFTAAVLGGIGNLAGAMLGGMLLGMIEALGLATSAT